MDRFRKEYTPIDDEQKALVASLKERGAELEANINGIPSNLEDAGRLKSLAITHLETAIMFAVKAATGAKPKSE
jgi:hypothetical protein